MSETIGTPGDTPAATPAAEACPGPDLLLLLAHGADMLDAEYGDDSAEGERVAAHVAGCARCAARANALATSLAAPPPPFDPLELLPAIKARLAEAAVPDASSAAASDALAGAVKLRCTFCRGGLAKSSGVYCARCLAPHHGDCFGEHGRCAAPGCDGREVVAARAVVTPPPARRRPRGLILLAAAALAGGGGLAALRPARELTSTPVLTPTPAPVAELRTQTYDVADLLAVRSVLPAPEETASDREVRRRLETQQITLHFDATPLTEAANFIRDVTGLNVHLTPELDGQLPVTLRLRNVPLSAALDAICAQVGASMEYRDEALTFSSLEAVSAARWSAEWLPPPAAGDPDAGRRAPDALLELVMAELGADAQVEVAQRTLVVTGGPEVHAAAARLLDRLHLRGLPPELAGAWFRPAPTPAGDPWLDQAREHLARLDRRSVTLNFPGTPLEEVFAFLHDIGLPPVRLDGPDSGAPIELRVHDVGARSAMLLAAKSAGWSFDVDRRGLAFRAPQRPPLEVRLQEAAYRALAEEAPDEPEPSVTFTSPAGATLAEVVAALQDQSGANLALERGVEGGARAALDVKGAPLGEALDRLLAPLGLGVRRSGAVRRIVPRAGASDTAERVARLAAALATRLPAGLDGSVADLASAVASAVGAEVHLGEGARASRARVRLPAGVTARQALELATLQTGLRCVLAWFEEDTLLVAIDGESTVGPLELALRALLRPSAWPQAPGGAARHEVDARAALLATLRGLLALDLQPAGDLVERAGRAVDAVRRAREALEERHAGLASLRPGPAFDDVVEELLRARQGTVAGLQRARRSLALLAATTDGLQERREALAAQARAAAEAVPLAQDPDAVTRALERARLLDEQVRAVDVEQARRLRERVRQERDLNLEEARLESTLDQQRARLRELGAWPAEARARRLALVRLGRGEAWSAVFPGSWEGWSLRGRRRAEHRFEAGLVALDRLGVVLDSGLRVEELLEEAPAARAGVPVGAALVGLRAANAPEGARVAPANLTGLADALGELAPESDHDERPARVAFRAEGRLVEVEVPVTAEAFQPRRQRSR